MMSNVSSGPPADVGASRASTVLEVAARKLIELPTKCVDNLVDNLIKYRARAEKFDWVFGLLQD
jgi:hypothetical protein